MSKFVGTFRIDDLKETQKHAQLVSKSIKPGSVILLQGDLGVGKTQWVRFFIQDYLNNKNLVVNSPSYSLVQEYQSGKKKIVHMDCYRLTDLNDLESTGFWDFLDDQNILCVEWGVLIPKSQLKERPLIKIEIRFLNETERELTCLLDG